MAWITWATAKLPIKSAFTRDTNTSAIAGKIKKINSLALPIHFGSELLAKMREQKFILFIIYEIKMRGDAGAIVIWLRIQLLAMNVCLQ